MESSKNDYERQNEKRGGGSEAERNCAYCNRPIRHGQTYYYCRLCGRGPLCNNHFYGDNGCAFCKAKHRKFPKWGIALAVIAALAIGGGVFYLLSSGSSPTYYPPPPESSEPEQPSPAPTTYYSLVTSVSPSGAGSISPSRGTYEAGATLPLTAQPGSYYKFVGWSGADDNAINPTTVTMDSDRDVRAQFEKSYQWIRYTMPPGSIVRSSVSYTKQLQAGEKVDGSVELTGKYYSVDWSYDWEFQILGPGRESVHQWTGHWVNTPHHDFSFTASYTGRYKISVSHVSSYSKNLTIKIWPPGWGYSG